MARARLIAVASTVAFGLRLRSSPRKRPRRARRGGGAPARVLLLRPSCWWAGTDIVDPDATPGQGRGGCTDTNGAREHQRANGLTGTATLYEIPTAQTVI